MCNPVFQSGTLPKEGNEARVSMQVLWSPLPLLSMLASHDFHHLNWYQTQALSSLLEYLSFFEVLRCYDLGWSILLIGPFPPLPFHEAYLSWEVQGTQTSPSLFQTHSSLNSDHLASPMSVLPFAVQGLFSSIKETEAHEEGVRSPFAPCHCSTSFLVSDSLWK